MNYTELSTDQKIQEVKRLIAGGEFVYRACNKVGLALDTWYRTQKKTTQTEQELLASVSGYSNEKLEREIAESKAYKDFLTLKIRVLKKVQRHRASQ